jgi:hypothetical protein
MRIWVGFGLAGKLSAVPALSADACVLAMSDTVAC